MVGRVEHQNVLYTKYFLPVQVILTLARTPNTKPLRFILLLFALVSSLITHSQERQVKVNGSNYTLYLKGFENRKPNSSAIIFENGLGVGLGHWNTIIDEIAQFAPVFSYDRAGVEKSDKVYQTPTPKFVAGNLKAILTAINIPPPYILVGHSLGGVYIRGYAGYYPNDVQGLIFIDPADFTETKEDWRILLRKLGMPDKRVEETVYDRLYSTTPVDSANFGPWSESQVLTGLRRTDFVELNNLPLPDVPIYFFVGGKFEVPVERWSKDFNHPEFFRVKTNYNMERWQKVIHSSSKGGNLIYLSKCGHFVHRDDPKAVISNIKIMVESLK